ncbi:SRPBCC family protein [Leptospira limi]|uniref:SRPBCC domain-containing protein n=1 Tax=Leptospira limi TaxID=2950023 RepID=A0ABT3LUK9_9LEPT|nr:SRPBCC family protein [Leptospira limi]MCW7461406.1 SRPBCC domain-containing protein [Leptospira limi]
MPSINQTLKIEFNIFIHSNVKKIWNLLVTPDSIKEYLYGTETISNWTIGSDIRFKGEWDGKTYEDKGTILNLEFQKELKYTYLSSFSGMPDLPENYSVIAMNLVEKKEGVVLRLCQTGFFSEEQQKHSEENWREILEKIRMLAEDRSV